MHGSVTPVTYRCISPSVYREGTPRAMHIYGYVTIALVTIIAVVCTVSLFLPGDLFGIIFG